MDLLKMLGFPTGCCWILKMMKQKWETFSKDLFGIPVVDWTQQNTRTSADPETDETEDVLGPTIIITIINHHEPLLTIIRWRFQQQTPPWGFTQQVTVVGFSRGWNHSFGTIEWGCWKNEWGIQLDSTSPTNQRQPTTMGSWRIANGEPFTMNKYIPK